VGESNDDGVPHAPTVMRGGAADDGMIYEKILGAGREQARARSSAQFAPPHWEAERMAQTNTAGESGA